MAGILFESYYGTSQLGEPYLEHHGVKGQEWGKRRWQNEDGSLTPAGKEHYGYGRTDDGSDYTLAKGLETQRYTKERDEEIGSERKYVTYTDHDNALYESFYPHNLRSNSEEDILSYGLENVMLPDRVFETKLTTIKDLNVAGKNTYVNTLREIFDDPESRSKYKLNSDKTYDKIQKLMGTKVADIVRGGAQNKAFNSNINAFNFGLQQRNSAINSDFFKRLKDKGYDAVEDQFSKNVDKTEGALIILDPKATVRKTSNKEILFNKEWEPKGKVDAKQGDKLRAKAERNLKYNAVNIVKEARKEIGKGTDPTDAEQKIAEKYGLDIDAVDYLMTRYRLEHSDDDYLMHHGVKGQKWYHRRYQNPDGSLTALGRIHYGFGKGRNEAGAKDKVAAYDKKRKEQRDAKRAEHAAAKAERSKEKEAAKREKILTSGTASEILKNSDKFTNQELQQAINRINLKTTLKNMDMPKARKSMVESIVDKINKTNTLLTAINNVKETSNKLAKVFEDPEEKEAEERKKAIEKMINEQRDNDFKKQLGKLIKETRENTKGTDAEVERAVKLAADKFIDNYNDAKSGKKNEDYDSFTKRLNKLNAKREKKDNAARLKELEKSSKAEAAAKAKEHNNQVKEEVERAKQLDKSIDKEIGSAKAQSAAWEHEALERLKGSRSNLSEAVKYYEADRVARKNEYPEPRDSQAAYDRLKNLFAAADSAKAKQSSSSSGSRDADVSRAVSQQKQATSALSRLNDTLQSQVKDLPSSSSSTMDIGRSTASSSSVLNKSVDDIMRERSKYLTFM